MAILLKDLNREEEAIAAYREALTLDPSLHDAHFNLSRIHEKARQPQDALRHLLAYRRHIHNHVKVSIAVCVMLQINQPCVLLGNR